jgi:hypothetical protein
MITIKKVVRTKCGILRREHSMQRVKKKMMTDNNYNMLEKEKYNKRGFLKKFCIAKIWVQLLRLNN